MKISVMRYTGFYLSLLAFFMILPSLSTASSKEYSYNGPSFQAVRIIRTTKGTRKSEIRQKIYRMPGRTRVDIPAPRGTNIGGQVMIIREDLGLVWMLNMANKTYIKRPYHKLKKRLEPKGTETVNGKSLKRYVVITSDQYMKSTVWKDENGIDVRTVSILRIPGSRERRTEIIYKDIQIGPLDKSLFELPDGYRPAGG